MSDRMRVKAVKLLTAVGFMLLRIDRVAAMG